MTDLIPTDGVRDPGLVRGWLERQPPLPSPTRVRQSAIWWALQGAPKIGYEVLRGPKRALAELKPIGLGLYRVLASWARWCAVAEYAAAAAGAEGSDRARHQERVELRKSGRRRFSLLAVLAIGGGGWWLIEARPYWAAIAGIALVGLFDLVGRHNPDRDETPLPGPAPMVLRDGVPLRQITQTLLDVALREALELGVAAPMHYDAARREYRLEVSCLDAITAEHLRAFERGIGAATHSIRALDTDVATIRELVIRDGDPLAEFEPAPWTPTGTVSITDALVLGKSMTEVPFALTFAGQHFRGVGATGSGKTRWFLRSCLSQVSACRDAVIWGIDLQGGGDEFPLWRDVIQRLGSTIGEAEQVLDAAIAEMDRRLAVLRALAEDDDPDNDQDEWGPNLGPALIIFVDEFHLVAACEGKNGKPDLLGKAEQIVRIGRKVWVSLVMLTQRTGNNDFGSQTMSSQCSTSVMLACDSQDTWRMVGTDRRDSGYTPHLFAPGIKGDPRDAGKCFLDSPMHRTPDVYRAYAPGANSVVKQWARQRIADGLPRLDRAPVVDEVLDATEVPPLLVAVESAFAEAGNPEWLATADLLPLVQANGWPGLGEAELSEGLPLAKNQPGSRKRRPGDANPRQGYLLASVRAALDQL